MKRQPVFRGKPAVAAYYSITGENQSNRCTNAFCSGVSVALRFQMRCALDTISGLSMRFITSVGSEFWIAEVYGAIATPMPDAAQLSDEAMLSFWQMMLGMKP